MSTIRILKLTKDDIDLVEKFLRNMHKKLQENPQHPLYWPYIEEIHRLLPQFDEGLPTELQYLSSMKQFEKDLKTEQSERKKQMAERLAKKGVTSKALIEQVAPASSPSKRSIPKKKSKDTKKTKPKKPTIRASSKSCAEHNSTGARAPRTSCKSCWAYYKHLHPDRFKQAYAKFLEK